MDNSIDQAVLHFSKFWTWMQAHFFHPVSDLDEVSESKYEYVWPELLLKFT
jgi:hypothetical protein